MRAYEIIWKKRQGKELIQEEIQFLIDGYIQNDIPDYQMAAWAMAVYFQGLSPDETAYLTLAMAHSGPWLDLSSIPGFKVDKHSTGGVGDTTTLILAPLVAAAGVPVAKMSGRGLGHTGGTIDKLHSIPGFRTDLKQDEFIDLVNKIGIAIGGQTSQLAPADKRLYALRDATATVDSLPLIAASILAKKLAGGAQGIVFDVKWGSGAFMKDQAQGYQLASLLVDTCQRAELQASALLTNMDQPLGRAIGNSLEVVEAMDILKGNGPEDLRNLCISLGGEMLFLAQACPTSQEGQSKMEELLDSGAALEKFAQWVRAQGGNPQVIEEPGLLGSAQYSVKVTANQVGYISEINGQELGLTAMALGAGRARTEDSIDYAAGIVLENKLGDYIHWGDTLAVLYSNSPISNHFLERVLNAFSLGEKPTLNPLISQRL